MIKPAKFFGYFPDALYDWQVMAAEAHSHLGKAPNDTDEPQLHYKKVR